MALRYQNPAASTKALQSRTRICLGVALRTAFPQGVCCMKPYNFRVFIEQDAESWRRFFPPLKDKGASTWGNTGEQALKDIQKVLSKIVAER